MSLEHLKTTLVREHLKTIVIKPSELVRMTRWLKKVERAITQLKTDVKRMEASALERCYAAQLAATAAINGYLQATAAAAEVTSTPNSSLVQSDY